MAIVGSNLTSGAAVTGGPWDTASISPSAYALVLVAVVIRNAASTDPTTPTVTGNGLTYTLVNPNGTALYDSSSSSRRKLFVFQSLGASPSAGAVTITAGEASAAAAWAVDQFINVDTISTAVQAATNADESGATNTITATLAAFGSTLNGTYGAIGAATGTLTITEGSGFTLLADVAGTGIDLGTEWKSTNDTSVDFSLSANDFMGIVGIEIKGSPTVTANYLKGRRRQRIDLTGVSAG